MQTATPLIYILVQCDAQCYESKSEPEKKEHFFIINAFVAGKHLIN